MDVTCKFIKTRLLFRKGQECASPLNRGQKLVGKGDNAGARRSFARGLIPFILKGRRARDNRMAVGAVQRTLAALKADKPALVVVAVRAKRPQVYVLRLESLRAEIRKVYQFKGILETAAEGSSSIHG